MVILWFVASGISLLYTIKVVQHFGLTGTTRITALNLLIPFAGLLYTFYIVHTVLPKLIKEQTGEDIPSPLLPYLKTQKEQFISFMHALMQKNLKK